MNRRWQLAMAMTLSVAWIATATAQARLMAPERPVGELAKFASNYEQSCHQTQAARLKALPQPASEIQKMQIEIVDEDVCPCMAAKIIEVPDVQLAGRILAKDKTADGEFFEPAFQQCSISVLRKMALPTCKADVSNGTMKPASVEAACQCYTEAVGKLDDKTLRDDAVAAYLNYEARVKDRFVQPYLSKLEVLRVECMRKHP